MGMKKQLQAAVLHKSAQVISNVTKFAFLIAEYPHSMWKFRQHGSQLRHFKRYDKRNTCYEVDTSVSNTRHYLEPFI
jgi:hypothetical protein